MIDLRTEPAPASPPSSRPCACCTAALPSRGDRRLRRWAWWLTAATVAWNAVEGLVAIASGVVASSIALVGYGLDSFMEVSSALVIAWRLSRFGGDEQANERAERRSVRLIALIFYAIALYVTADAIARLLGMSQEPAHSPWGLAITALSMVVMPILAWGKRRVAGKLGSVALRADSAQTQLCWYLSIVVFLGLGANALFGWWWMDPIAGLVVAALAVTEGYAAWTSGELCEC
jgi:divalent metal cation (Fe/Co/Zn/Cd) transporter